MNEEKLSLIALSFVPGIGNFTIRQLISYCGSAKAVFTTPKSKILKIPGIGKATSEALNAQQWLKEAEEEWRKAEKAGANMVAYTDNDYPRRLREIHDAPVLLFTKGPANLNAEKIIAIVGTRNMTSYGQEMTEKLVEQLVPHQPLIVSGLAYGIDITAHKASLKVGIPTLGVMATGIDKVYPALHQNTAIKMIEQGGLLTENRVGTIPDPPKFPARNRIIAGLADVTLVIEAALKGGALITAEIANSYDRDVFAVPGNVGLEYSDGCNALIKRNKAHLLTDIGDLEYIMQWEKGMERPRKQEGPDTSLLGEEEKLVVETLKDKGGPIPIDQLSWSTRINASKLASILLQLEFQGWVESLPGKRFGLKGMRK
jgi:DNA processing protein